MSFKVLGVGLPKTGTTTLYEALLSTGLQVLHQKSGWRQPHAGVLMMQAMREQRPLHQYLPGIDAVTQLDNCGKGEHAWPQFDEGFLRQFRHENPDAVVVLHTRSSVKTINSINHWADFRERLCKSAPGLKPGASDTDLTVWQLKYYDFIRKFFTGDKLFLEFEIEDPCARERLELMIGRQVMWWGKANGWKGGLG